MVLVRMRNGTIPVKVTLALSTRASTLRPSNFTSRNLQNTLAKIRKGICTRLLIVVLYMRAIHDRRHYKGPSTGNWLNKLWDIHITDYLLHSCKKRMRVISQVCWVNKGREKNGRLSFINSSFMLFTCIKKTEQTIHLKKWGKDCCGEGRDENWPHWVCSVDWTLESWKYFT